MNECEGDRWRWGNEKPSDAFGEELSSVDQIINSQDVNKNSIVSGEGGGRQRIVHMEMDVRDAVMLRVLTTTTALENAKLKRQ